MPKNAQTTTQLIISHASKVMLKILQARLQQYVNCELSDVQASFRKGRGSRDQNFSQFIVIYTVKTFGIVNKAEIDVFWNSLAFLMIQRMLAI